MERGNELGVLELGIEPLLRGHTAGRFEQGLARPLGHSRWQS
jgi:hypothetical protein